MLQKTIDKAKTDISRAFAETFKIEEKSYERSLKKAGKHLPHKVKKDAEFLIEAEKNLKHPRMRKLVKPQEVKRARDAVLRQTQGSDPARERSAARFSWGGSLVLNLILFAVVYYAILAWIGAV